MRLGKYRIRRGTAIAVVAAAGAAVSLVGLNQKNVVGRCPSSGVLAVGPQDAAACSTPTVPAPPLPPPTGGLANVWVSTQGSDATGTLHCAYSAVSQTNPDASGITDCKSWQKAYALLPNTGGVVGVLCDGFYPQTTLSAAAKTAGTVTFTNPTDSATGCHPQIAPVSRITADITGLVLASTGNIIPYTPSDDALVSSWSTITTSCPAGSTGPPSGTACWDIGISTLLFRCGSLDTLNHQFTNCTLYQTGGTCPTGGCTVKNTAEIFTTSASLDIITSKITVKYMDIGKYICQGPSSDVNLIGSNGTYFNIGVNTTRCLIDGGTWGPSRGIGPDLVGGFSCTLTTCPTDPTLRRMIIQATGDSFGTCIGGCHAECVHFYGSSSASTVGSMFDSIIWRTGCELFDIFYEPCTACSGQVTQMINNVFDCAVNSWGRSPPIARTRCTQAISLGEKPGGYPTPPAETIIFKFNTCAPGAALEIANPGGSPSISPQSGSQFIGNYCQVQGANSSSNLCSTAGAICQYNSWGNPAGAQCPGTNSTGDNCGVSRTSSAFVNVAAFDSSWDANFASGFSASPPLGSVPAALCPPTNVLGIARPTSGTCNAGAY